MDAGLDTLVHRRLLHSARSPATPARKRASYGHRPGGPHAVGRPGDHGDPSDRRFLRIAAKRLCHLFPKLPAQPGYHKRRRRLADTIGWLMGVFDSQSPGYTDELLLIDSTPVECARSRETVKRSPGRGRRLRLVRLALALFLGVQVALRSSLSTGLHVRSRSPRPHVTNVWWASSCSPDAGAREERSLWVATVMPAASSHAPSVN